MGKLIMLLAMAGLAPNAALAQTPPKSDAPPALGQETLVPNEAALIQQINDLTLQIFKQAHATDTTTIHRDANPKTHGLVRAQFIVLDDLPANLRYGVFKAPSTFDAWIRFSAGSSSIHPDTAPNAHGMAIKLTGVPGEKLLDAEKNETTQDFVLINYPGFVNRSLPDYLELHNAIQSGKPAQFFGTHPEEARASFQLNHQQFENPLQVRYWSQTPYRLGPSEQAVKYSVRPLTLQSNVRPAVRGPDYLTEVMERQLSAGDVYFEFLVQVQKDPVTMPIEDAVVIWDEKAYPPQRVALIRIPKQSFTSPGQMHFGENLSFTPWHSLPEHRPLGGMNRARRVIYNTLSEYRHQRNEAPRREPTGKEVFQQ